MSDERPQEEAHLDERQAERTGEAPGPLPESESAPEGEATDQPSGSDSEGPVDKALESLQQERDELFARLQRVSADYQNYMKRAQQNLADSIGLAKGDLAKQFIGVLDHFDNALSKEPEGEEARRLYDGVRIVRDELMKVLESIGVERIEVEPGEPFDPNIHEALLRQPAEGVEPGRVSALFQPGYRLGDRVLRPAKVAVAPEDTQE
jgi:molecular chaperone GrpE